MGGAMGIDRLRLRGGAVGGRRVRGHEDRHVRQLPDHGGGQSRRCQASLAGGLPGRRGHGFQRGRPRPARCGDRIPAVRQRSRYRRCRSVQHHCRHRAGGLLHRPLRPGRGRHLHQGRRRRRRSGGQGRSGHSRGRPPEPGGDRRQRGRQRRRRGRHGGRPLRVLRGFDRGAHRLRGHRVRLQFLRGGGDRLPRWRSRRSGCWPPSSAPSSSG